MDLWYIIFGRPWADFVAEQIGAVIILGILGALSVVAGMIMGIWL